ncbi:hypothetical protein ACE1CI_12715 [Aerosakkonemataceae cyanobacterium BLCC-F50]|uniref:Uncharacterized protein n=1 Tax=Floridaenema flaviceps BLCC-F50 TaxID=3153642 RepID=A0ABV4XPY0_9CYAN
MPIVSGINPEFEDKYITWEVDDKGRKLPVFDRELFNRQEIESRSQFSYPSGSTLPSNTVIYIGQKVYKFAFVASFARQGDGSFRVHTYQDISTGTYDSGASLQRVTLSERPFIERRNTSGIGSTSFTDYLMPNSFIVGHFYFYNETFPSDLFTYLPGSTGLTFVWTRIEKYEPIFIQAEPPPPPPILIFPTPPIITPAPICDIKISIDPALNSGREFFCMSFDEYDRLNNRFRNIDRRLRELPP